MNAQDKTSGRYAEVNGLRMYYELHGSGQPLVLLHGGGSTINSSFGRVLPGLSKKHLVIAVELQAHGRTPDRNRPLSFESDADDIAVLLAHLQINRVDVMGFSNGGTTAIQLAIRHPQMVNRIILASAIFQRVGMQPGFFEGMKLATFDQMPQPLKDSFLEVNPDTAALATMFNRDVERMNTFTDIPVSLIQGIRSRTLVINGDAEVVLADHALLLSKLIPGSRLLVLPSGHGDYLGEICSPEPDQDQIQFVLDSVTKFLSR